MSEEHEFNLEKLKESIHKDIDHIVENITDPTPKPELEQVKVESPPPYQTPSKLSDFTLIKEQVLRNKLHSKATPESKIESIVEIMRNQSEEKDKKDIDIIFTRSVP